MPESDFLKAFFVGEFPTKKRVFWKLDAGQGAKFRI
jgi:hypothetical protein